MTKRSDPGFGMFELMIGSIPPEMIYTARADIANAQEDLTDVAITQKLLAEFAEAIAQKAATKMTETMHALPQTTDDITQTIVLNSIKTAYFQAFALVVASLLPELGWTHPELTVKGDDDA